MAEPSASPVAVGTPAPSAPDTVAEGVGVVVRVRPLSTKERADPSVHVCIQTLPDIVVIDPNAHKRSTGVDGKAIARTTSTLRSSTAPGKGSAVSVLPASQPVRSSTRPYQFSVDHVFHTHTSQIEVYEESCKRVVEGVFHGINGSILAYGATGSGKTHTMFGSTMSAAGIVYQAVQDIFAEKERLEEEEGKRVRIKCSFLEVYNEEVFDLLVKTDSNGNNNNTGGSAAAPAGSRPGKRVPLQVRETGSTDGGLQIPGLTHIFPETLEDFTRGIEHGHAQRFVAATGANAQSSRSHAIITVEVEVRDDPARATALLADAAAAAAADSREDGSASEAGSSPSNNTSAAASDSVTSAAATTTSAKPVKRKKAPTQTVTIATIQFGDLAGSERAASTSNTGLRLREGGNINRSLLALGAVVQSLALQKAKRRQTGGQGGGKIFIPYRGSKLTRLLRDCIGGNCRTMMLFCVSPSTKHIEETVNTMKFAMNAREIQVVAHRNEFAVNSSQLAKTQETVIEELRAELARTRAALARYAGEAPPVTEVQEAGDNVPNTTEAAVSSASSQHESPTVFGRQMSSVSIKSPSVANTGGMDDGAFCFNAGEAPAPPASPPPPAPPVVAAAAATTVPPPRPGTPSAVPPRGTVAPSSSAVGCLAMPTVVSLSANQVELSANNSMTRPSVSSRTARPSVFAENTRLFTNLEAKLKDYSAQKEGLYYEVRDAEERERDGEAQLRDLQWRLATFLVSDAYGSRARGEVDAYNDSSGGGDGGGGGGAGSTVGVAGLRRTIAKMEEAQAQQSSQLAELTHRLEEADRQFAATRATLLRERQGTTLELLLDNARLRQSCTEAECLAAHYHQECRSLLNSEAEYAEALSKCVGALQRLRPLLTQLMQQQQQQHHLHSYSNSSSSSNARQGRGSGSGSSSGGVDSSSAVAALESADMALLFALLPTASTAQRMQAFESALRTTTAAQRQQQEQSQQPMPSPHALEQDGQVLSSHSFLHPPLAPSPTDRSGSGSGSRSPTRAGRSGRSGSTPQSNQLAEQFRDLVATAELMHLTSGGGGDGTGTQGTVVDKKSRGGIGGGGVVRPRHRHTSATAAPPAPSRAFGRTFSLTGLTTATSAATSAAATSTRGTSANERNKTKTNTLTPSPLRYGSSGASAAAAAAAGVATRTKTATAKRSTPASSAAAPRPLQRALSAPTPFSRSASAQAILGKRVKAVAQPKPSTTPTRGLYGSPVRTAWTSNSSSNKNANNTKKDSSATTVTPEKRPNKSGRTFHASTGHRLSPKAMWSIEGTNGSTSNSAHAKNTNAAAFTRSNTVRSFGSPNHKPRSSADTAGGSSVPRTQQQRQQQQSRLLRNSTTLSTQTASRDSAEDTPHSGGSSSSVKEKALPSAHGKRTGKAAAGASIVSVKNGTGGYRLNGAPPSPPPQQQQQQHGSGRRVSAAGVEGGRRGGVGRKLTRSLTSSSAPAEHLFAPTSLVQQHAPLEQTNATTLSPFVSPRSSLGGDADNPSRLHRPHDRQESTHSTQKPNTTTATTTTTASLASSPDGNSNNHNPNHQPQSEPPKLTIATLLERSATVPALSHYTWDSPLHLEDGGAYVNKENHQYFVAAAPSRPRTSLPDDLTVSRSTLFSDSPSNSRDLAASGNYY